VVKPHVLNNNFLLRDGLEELPRGVSSRWNSRKQFSPFGGDTPRRQFRFSCGLEILTSNGGFEGVYNPANTWLRIKNSNRKRNGNTNNKRLNIFFHFRAMLSCANATYLTPR
jgi:hypothetical protein